MDLRHVLRRENHGDPGHSDDNVLDKVVRKSDSSLPLLPRAYAADSRIYTTLTKGYMKVGRIKDVVQMLEAMRQEEDRASRPDHVTYATVVSAFVAG